MEKGTRLFDINPPNPPNEGILFVDHSKAGRSGHLGHALVEYAPGKILAFYPNCSDLNKGHSGDGWMEYKRSEDKGKTWSEPEILQYSKDVYNSGNRKSVMCEKAVLAADSSIVLFNLECEYTRGWHPHRIPTCMVSKDSGYTWESAKPASEQPGRIYDAFFHDGCIFALEFCNDTKKDFTGSLSEHKYNLYVSTDNAKTFTCRSTLLLDTYGRGYGTMELLHDGSLIVYVYNTADEKNMDCVISQDMGISWSKVQTAFFAKKIRNPQMAAFKNGFILHGRSGSYGEGSGHFVIYTSNDGLNWDEGTYLRMQEAGAGAYSNNLIVSDPQRNVPERLLIQASHAYEDNKTNILHWWLE